MFKSEMERMVKAAGGMIEAQEAEGLKVGFKFQTRNGWGLESTSPMAEYEVIGFAAPNARGRVEKWDDDAESLSVILHKRVIVNGQMREAHGSDEYHIRSCQRYEVSVF